MAKPEGFPPIRKRRATQRVPRWGTERLWRAGNGRASLARPLLRIFELEIQRNLRGQRSRSYIVRSAEGRQEVIERIFIGHVDRSQVEVRLVAIAVKDIVLTQRRVE